MVWVHSRAVIVVSLNLCLDCKKPVCKSGGRCKSCAQKAIKADRPRMPVLVDDRHRNDVEGHRWWVVNGYVKGYPFGRHRPMVSLHSYVWFLEYGELHKNLDHISRDRQDNRLQNLRPATPSLQGHNRLSANVRHRAKQPRRPWEASIHRKGTTFYRCFSSRPDADAWVRNAKETIIEFEALLALD